MFGLGAPEIVALCALGILLFGKNLPGIARSLGKSVVSFRQGLQGVEDEIETSVSRREPDVRPQTPQRLSPEAPKFSEHAEVAHNSTTV